VELLAETGFIGFALLGWFFFQLGRRLIQGLEKSAATSFPLAAISIAALAAMALHEGLDSNLQIPANAFLFTLLASAGLRMVTEQRAGSTEQGAGSKERGDRSVGATGWSVVGNEAQRAESKEKRIGDVGQGTWSWEPGVAKWDEGAWSWQHGTPIRKGYRLAAPRKMLVSTLVAFSAAVLVICAVSQEPIPYPYNPARPSSLADAKRLVLSWPASVNAHLSFLLIMKGKTSLSSQLAQAKAALWVEPTNPYVRDFYAATLLSLNRKDEGLKEIARSVGDSPLLRNHLYLTENFLQRLSESEQNAVERGLNRAFTSGYPDAQNSLAGFFVKLNRFADEAALYERMARSEHDAGKKNELLINSAAAYLKAQNEGKAELLFRKAIVALPTDPRPYQELATRVYGRKDFLRAQEVVAQGIKNGAPPFSLYLSLAEAAQTTGNPSDQKRALSLAKTEIERAAKQVDDPYPFYVVLADASRKIGDRDQEVAALLKLLEFRPQSLDTLSRLAKVYFEQRNFDRAALYFSRIINIQPDTAEVYHQLAVAEEGRYHFAAADNAYARAAALDPDNAVYRKRYEQFRKRIEQNKVSGDGKGRGLDPAGSREPGARS
jgi:tetratricopeptide (TPR) repeat protein